MICWSGRAGLPDDESKVALLAEILILGPYEWEEARGDASYCDRDPAHGETQPHLKSAATDVRRTLSRRWRSVAILSLVVGSETCLNTEASWSGSA